MKSEESFQFTVSSKEAGERLDRYLHKKFPRFSRSYLKSLIEDDKVSVQGKLSKPSHLLKEGESVGVEIPLPKKLEVRAEAIPLDIIYEDEDLLVLNKAAEMVVHPAGKHVEGTLVNALLHHCQNLSGIGGVMRPGIVHRLDKGTSGVMVVAKSDLAHRSLAEQFHSRVVEKTYLGLVWGIPRHREGAIHAPLGRSLKDRKKISTRSRRTREATTHYRVLQATKNISLLELKPLTGRTHQIRVHLTAMGHPIVGDPVYGKGVRKLSILSSELLAILQKHPYQFLHAASLSFIHPATGQRISFSAEPRGEMEEFMKCLFNPRI